MILQVWYVLLIDMETVQFHIVDFFFYKAWSPHIYNVIMMICLIIIYVKIFWTICHDLCCSNFCNNEKELSAISDCSVVCIFEQSQLICIVST